MPNVSVSSAIDNFLRQQTNDSALVAIGGVQGIATDVGETQVGFGSLASNESTSVGYGASSNYRSVAYGYGATAIDNTDPLDLGEPGRIVAIGNYSYGSSRSVAVGYSTHTSLFAVAVGYGAVSNVNGVAVGYNAVAGTYADPDCIAIGSGTNAAFGESIAIGTNVSTYNYGGINIGNRIFSASYNYNEGVWNKAALETPTQVEVTNVPNQSITPLLITIGNDGYSPTHIRFLVKDAGGTLYQSSLISMSIITP